MSCAFLYITTLYLQLTFFDLFKKATAPPSAICRTPSALASKAFANDSQAASTLYTMAVLWCTVVYQAKLLHDMDKSGREPVMFKE